MFNATTEIIVISIHHIRVHICIDQDYIYIQQLNNYVRYEYTGKWLIETQHTSYIIVRSHSVHRSFINFLALYAVKPIISLRAHHLDDSDLRKHQDVHQIDSDHPKSRTSSATEIMCGLWVYYLHIVSYMKAHFEADWWAPIAMMKNAFFSWVEAICIKKCDAHNGWIRFILIVTPLRR